MSGEQPAVRPEEASARIGRTAELLAVLGRYYRSDAAFDYCLLLLYGVSGILLALMVGNVFRP